MKALMDNLLHTSCSIHVMRVAELKPSRKNGKEAPLQKLQKLSLSNCSNWRGSAHLSIPGKVFSKIILNRLAKGAYGRHAQGGKSCCLSWPIICGETSTLRMILQKTENKQSSLELNFINLSKAFHSTHRATSWEILQQYGTTLKYIGIMKSFYPDSKCALRLDDDLLSSWFGI